MARTLAKDGLLPLTSHDWPLFTLRHTNPPAEYTVDGVCGLMTMAETGPVLAVEKRPRGAAIDGFVNPTELRSRPGRGLPGPDIHDVRIQRIDGDGGDTSEIRGKREGALACRRPARATVGAPENTRSQHPGI